MITSGLVIQNKAYSIFAPSSYSSSRKSFIRPAVTNGDPGIPVITHDFSVPPSSLRYSKIFGKGSTSDERMYYILRGIERRKELEQSLVQTKLKSRIEKRNYQPLYDMRPQKEKEDQSEPMTGVEPGDPRTFSEKEAAKRAEAIGRELQRIALQPYRERAASIVSSPAKSSAPSTTSSEPMERRNSLEMALADDDKVLAGMQKLALPPPLAPPPPQAVMERLVNSAVDANKQVRDIQKERMKDLRSKYASVTEELKERLKLIKQSDLPVESLVPLKREGAEPDFSKKPKNE